MLRYLRLRRSAALSRWLLECLAALSLLSYCSSFTHFLSLLRHFLPSLLNPLYAFLVGNFIILALVLKSSAPAEEDHLLSATCAQSLPAFDDLLSLPAASHLLQQEDKDGEEAVVSEVKEEKEEPEEREEYDDEEEEVLLEREIFSVVVEDDGEAFRRRIEAFIANQLSFIEKEESSLLRQDTSSLPASGSVA